MTDAPPDDRDDTSAQRDRIERSSSADRGRRPHVVVVGGGISGLAAAWQLCRDRHDLRVTVLESSTQLGGKLRIGELEGLTLDEGAESVLATRPEAVRLIEDLGLADRLVAPATTQASVVLPDGRQSMCDSCPDMTVHDGQLVWSCRLEERLKYGELMRMRPQPARKETERAPT